MPDMLNPLADDAEALTKQCMTYTESQGVIFLSGAHYLQINEGVTIPMVRADAYFTLARAQIIDQIVAHLLQEVGQPQFSTHGSRSTYTSGCRGLLCRRGNRETLRTTTGAVRNGKFLVVDQMLEEAEKRIADSTIVYQETFRDRVATRI